MTKSSIDRVKLTITCPACGHSFKERFARLKHDPVLTCPGCGHDIKIEGGALLHKAEGAMEGGIAGLRRRIQEAKKRLR